MQEGAGVRQLIEDELRRSGERLRDFDVPLELGLQESVRSAVLAGYGVTFISRSAVETELAAGRLGEARVRGLNLVRDVSLVRAARKSPTRVAEAFVAFGRTPGVIVRWGLDALPEVLAELGSSARCSSRASAGRPSISLPRPRGTRSRRDRIEAPDDVDGILAVGGGSAIDTAKAPSAREGLPLVSVPTTYSGSEWTPTFGVREPDRKMVGGGGGANLAGIVYDPQLTLGLPRAESGGTAMNALAHPPRRSTCKGEATRATSARSRGRG